jgi:hypothetical protein
LRRMTDSATRTDHGVGECDIGVCDESARDIPAAPNTAATYAARRSIHLARITSRALH